MTKKYILTQSQLEAIVFRAGSYAVGGSNYGADAVAIIDLLRSLKPVEPLSDEHITDTWNGSHHAELWVQVTQFARAIEQRIVGELK